MIRIFVAFPLRNDLSKSFLEVGKINDEVNGIRWTPPENYHITIFFIGEIEEKNLSEVEKILDKIFFKQPAFTLDFDSVVFAGNNKTMIWGRFKNDEKFNLLSKKFYDSLNQFMIHRNIFSEPIPHCTIARIKKHANLEKVDLKVTLPEQTILNINHAELWQTIQTNEGVKYKSLQKFLFQ